MENIYSDAIEVGFGLASTCPRRMGEGGQRGGRCRWCGAEPGALRVGRPGFSARPRAVRLREGRFPALRPFSVFARKSDRSSSPRGLCRTRSAVHIRLRSGSQRTSEDAQDSPTRLDLVRGRGGPRVCSGKRWAGSWMARRQF